MKTLSKLQIRAKVLSVISEIKVLNEYNEINLKKLYDELSDITDKETLLDVFIKEFIKMDENEFVFSGCLIKDLITNDCLQDKVFEILKSSNYSDEAKYKLVQLLRITGSDFDYNIIPQYFDNPRDILDTDTKKLLENAILNPEAMLDFLDFVSAVADQDRNLLLQSLKLDYTGDMLANIIYPILYSDFNDNFKLDVIDVLSESKSSLAIAPFNYLLETSENEEIITACKTGLKKLKLAGATEEKALEYFYNIIKDSVPAEFYTTIPDGNGNQALLISRINNKSKYSLSAVVINDIEGVIDCFGFFNISQDEMGRVLSKFYQSEGKYKVTPQYAKTRIEEGIKLTIQNKNPFPYEFICWDTLMKDISPKEKSVKDEIKNNLKPAITDKDTILTLLTKDYSFRWYIRPGENKELNEVIDNIYSQDDIDIDKLNTIIKENKEKIFNADQEDIWKKRILQCIYLLLQNKNRTDAELFYAILDNEDHFLTFKTVIIQRSIFNQFIAMREASKESLLTANIFRKKQIQKEKYDIKKIEKVINIIKKNWINE